ncbi:Hypothetical predicted protein [Mytilus galloprovincialis]|uniref:CRIB domain-containing protein n=1 Tax=Mytilus galloprovincialis TaxID=29158 RepID=A0A8B6EZZ8_MYTGA|nr:Hypothetical predicted protein [Mytilus galloprovincialis]
MNISKPTKFQHNIHATYDPRIGDVVLCKSKSLMTDAKEMNISGPTEFKHNIHAKCDPRTGKVVMFSPKIETSNSIDDESYDCNNCNELYYQWKRDQVKIKELQEENHFMLAMAARLCLRTSDTDGCSAYDDEFGYSFYGNVKMREFTESMNFIAQALISMANNQRWSDETMHQEKAEMQNEILMLRKQLRESRQNRAKEMNATMVQAQYQFHAAKQDFELRVDRTEKELCMLKSHLIGLQDENDSLRQQMRNAKLLFTEWHSTSSRVSSALNQDTSVFDLKKENELLKKDLQQLDSDRNRLNEEVTTTMNQLLNTRNCSSRPSVQQNSDSEENDRNETVDCISQHTTSSGKQVSYNITASAVNFIDKSSVKYDQRGGEISETVI